MDVIWLFDQVHTCLLTLLAGAVLLVLLIGAAAIVIRSCSITAIYRWI